MSVVVPVDSSDRGPRTPGDGGHRGRRRKLRVRHDACAGPVTHAMRRLRRRRRAPPRSPTRRTHVPAVVGFRNGSSTEVDRKSSPGTQPSQVRRWNRRFPAAPRNREGPPTHQGSGLGKEADSARKDPSRVASSHKGGCGGAEGRRRVRRPGEPTCLPSTTAGKRTVDGGRPRVVPQNVTVTGPAPEPKVPRRTQEPGRIAPRPGCETVNERSEPDLGAGIHTRRLRGRRRAPPRSPFRRTHVPAVNDCR